MDRSEQLQVLKDFFAEEKAEQDAPKRASFRTGYEDILDDPVGFAKALVRAGFTSNDYGNGVVWIQFVRPIPHKHEWKAKSAVSLEPATYWSCSCGATATTYAPVPHD